MNSLQVFKNSDFGEIRTVLIGDEPYFVGKDVAEILGYADPSSAVSKNVDDEDKTTLLLEQAGSNYKSKTTCINESGLYSLILSSKLPTAKAFKRWVTSEVLPSIRKHGAYMTPDKIEEVLTSPDTIIKLATQLKEERQARTRLEKEVEKNKHKVLFADSVSASSTSIPVGDLAKLIKQNGYDIGQNRLFAWMRSKGYLMKNGARQNMPTQWAMEMGLFQIQENTVSDADGNIHIARTARVTGKGQVYFINCFIAPSQIAFCI